MPEEDGYSLIGRIRRLPDRSVNSLPALALSAFATNESKQRALDAGFDHYCTKPFEPDELTRDILRLTQLRLDSEAAVHI
jgi:CheY-like chemotaxis protein